MAALEGRLADARAAAARLRETSKSKREAVVASVLDGAPLDSFPERLTTCERACADESSGLADLRAWAKVMEMGLTKADHDGRCLLCSRPFDAAELAQFRLSTQEKTSQQLPLAMRDKEAALREASDLLAVLQRSRPRWEECKRLQDEDIPAAEAAQAALAEQLKGAHEVNDQAEAALGGARDRARAARDGLHEAAAGERLWREAGVLRKRAESQRSQLSHLAAGSKSLDELSREVAQEEAKLSDAEHARSSLATAREQAAAEVTRLERGLASQRDALARLDKEHERGAAFSREKCDLDAQQALLKSELQDVGRRLAGARADKAAAEQGRAALRGECAAREAAAASRVRALERDLDSLSLQSRGVADYDAAGKGEALQARASPQKCTPPVCAHPPAAARCRRCGRRPPPPGGGRARGGRPRG